MVKHLTSKLNRHKQEARPPAVVTNNRYVILISDSVFLFPALGEACSLQQEENTFNPFMHGVSSGFAPLFIPVLHGVHMCGRSDVFKPEFCFFFF